MILVCKAISTKQVEKPISKLRKATTVFLKVKKK